MALTWSPKQFELARAEELALSASLSSSRPWIVSGLVLSAGTGLNVAISAGVAWIDGYYVEWDASAEEAVTGSATNHVWIELTRDVNDNVTAVDFVVNTTGVAPTGDNVKLGTATTDGSSVTGVATTGRSPETQVLVESVFGRGGIVVAASGDYDADEVDYDNATSGLVATDVQAAVDELAARAAGGGWTGISILSTDTARANNTQTTVYSIPVEANKTYAIEAVIFVDDAAGSFSIQVPSGATASGNFAGNSMSGVNYIAGFMRNLENIDLTSTLTNLQNTSGYKTLIIITGIVVVDVTAGDINLRFANGGSGTLNVRKGSNIKIKDIT